MSLTALRAQTPQERRRRGYEARAEHQQMRKVSLWDLEDGEKTSGGGVTLGIPRVEVSCSEFSIPFRGKGHIF